MKKRLLFIDDNDSLIASFTPILESLNFDVTRLADAEAGISVLGKETFDVVILDQKISERILYFLEMSLVPMQKRVVLAADNVEAIQGSKFPDFISATIMKPFLLDDLIRKIEGR